MDKIILHQLLQRSGRSQFVKGVTRSVELQVYGESAMLRAKVPHSDPKERYQLHRSGIRKRIIPSCGLKAVVRQACVGT